MFKRDKHLRLLDRLLALQLDLNKIEYIDARSMFKDASWQLIKTSEELDNQWLKQGANMIYNTLSISKENAKREMKLIHIQYGFDISKD